jgi:hypothetical protein
LTVFREGGASVTKDIGHDITVQQRSC